MSGRAMSPADLARVAKSESEYRSERVKRGIAESKRGRGRPGIGRVIEVRLPPDLLAYVEDVAARLDVARPEAVRRIIAASASVAPAPGRRRKA